MSSPVIIRASTPNDVRSIAEIYSYHVLKGTGSFEETPPSVEEIASRRESIVRHGMPWLVAELDGVVVGYAYAGPFRARAAYRFTLEDSVYISPDHQGHGIGRRLLERLIEECRTAGYKQMLALIGDSQNVASIRVHERCGFQHTGVFKDVGVKFERYLDVVLMQLAL
jgi:phosphinothricin acetyltransferase